MALVKESVADEVAHFQKEYWSGEVLLDSKLEFFGALGGGDSWNSGIATVVKSVQSPVLSSRANFHHFRKFYRSGAAMNLRGEGLVGGGCFVLNVDGSIAYSFLETVIGEQPPLDDVISAVREACH